MSEVKVARKEDVRRAIDRITRDHRDLILALATPEPEMSGDLDIEPDEATPEG